MSEEAMNETTFVRVGGGRLAVEMPVHGQEKTSDGRVVAIIVDEWNACSNITLPISVKGTGQVFDRSGPCAPTGDPTRWRIGVEALRDEKPRTS